MTTPVDIPIDPSLVDLYKDLHKHPELGFGEHRTVGLVVERLESAGFDVTTGVGRTGVVGILRNGDGPTIALRADMDALPRSRGHRARLREHRHRHRRHG
ncbi:peptidase M20 family protein [Gordonia rubripertincta NBRC 101908]|uniref:Peptidase M20 family protein n=1 Tax=Gordonia rubripertincta NBRC 101908 TaxID=1077975 RepID=A0ABQ0HZ08_GORRU|nr:peptidase M20 family protein [Gordonia rubripertincta NBRC 101908]